MSNRIAFACPACTRRLKTSPRNVGRRSACPGCGVSILVPPQTPEEEAPLLVMDDGHRRGSAGKEFLLPQ